MTAINAAHVENRLWQQEVYKFLLSYRSTPHSTTNVPPSQLLYNRQIRGALPTLPRKHHLIDRHAEAHDNHELKNEKRRNYANQHRRTKRSFKTIGDKVLIK